MKESQKDSGFTLIELLIVMAVTGILAAIAIPTYLIQQAKAHDNSTMTGVSTVGEEIATYFVDGTGPLTLNLDAIPGSIVVSDGSWSTTVNVTHGVAFPTSGAWADLGNPNGWCVSLTNPKGAVKTFNYSATNGLEVGSC